MQKFCDELWRIVKFILITGLVNVIFSLANSYFIRSAAASNAAFLGVWVSASSWIFLLLTTAIATLLNRYFTFRATEKWYIALPVMLIAAVGWQVLQAYPMSIAARHGAEIAMSMSYLLSMIWPILSYLLQRCVIYCHTVDTTGWYRRFHPTNEEGVYPNE